MWNKKKAEEKKDSHGDGVLDQYDQCPNTFGTVANNGCPNVTPPPSTNAEEVFIFPLSTMQLKEQ